MSADIVAADQLKAIVQRVERLEAEIADLNADKSEIYKEARANGFDVKVIKKVVSKRKMDEHEREEQDHVFDIYWDAVHGLNLVHAHARENIAQFDANPRLIKQVVDGMQTEAGRAALVGAVDVMIEREVAQESQAKASGDNGATAQADEEPADCMTGDASRSSRGDDTPATNSPSDDGAIAAVNGKAGLANADGVELPSSVQIDPTEDRGEGPSLDGDADANAGGNDVVRNALRVPTSVTGEGAASALPDGGDVVQEYVPPVPMKRLAYAHCFPELTKAQYGRLEFSISGLGIKNPIIRVGDVIIDGWARYNIARSLGIDYPVKSYDGKDVLLDVIEWQRASREFTPAQEAKIAADLAKEIPHRANDIMAAFGLAEALEAAE